MNQQAWKGEGEGEGGGVGRNLGASCQWVECLGSKRKRRKKKKKKKKKERLVE